MKCRICHSKKTSEVFNLGRQPLANKYPKNTKEIKNEKKFLLNVFFCKNCKSAQIKNIINRRLMFEKYFYLSSVNLGLKKHFNNLAKKLIKFNFVVDIGSNDGILLKPLKKLKVSAVGIDPSLNVGKIANKKNLKTFIGFFDKKIINKILQKYSQPDAIVASSVVTHLENPIQFAKNIKIFLKENGILILEIEYLHNFIKNLEYERFYFDRPFYYSATSINILFKSVNMSLIDIEKINIHGGSLRLFVKNSKNEKMKNRCKKILDLESKYLNFHQLKSFNNQIIKESSKFKKELQKLKEAKKVVIGYGAPARVSTITNFAKIGQNLIDYIIDDSPIKQNKFSPGSHIKILPRKKNLNKNIDIVIVFAYEYFLEIKKKFKNIKVKFYKPIPFKILK